MYYLGEFLFLFRSNSKNHGSIKDIIRNDNKIEFGDKCLEIVIIQTHSHIIIINS